MTRRARETLVLLALVASAAAARAQRSPSDTLRSPVASADGRVTFQLYAPKAAEVRVRSGTPSPIANQRMTRSDAGVWTLTTTLAPDFYVYWFDVDGVPVVDPKNPVARMNRTVARSVVEISGAASAFFAERDVPHGAVATRYLRSAALGAPRRVHVYTPPGYETSARRYPVLYLLHGSGDTDEGWTSAGRANFILDNLIAAGRAVPMILVMPDGHLPRSGASTAAQLLEHLGAEVPAYVEARYRVRADRDGRAIAGLSMGGGQALSIALRRLDRFSQIGVFSAGFLDEDDDEDLGVDSLARRHDAVLRDPRTPGRVRLLWLATGQEDALLPTTKATLAVFDRSGIRYTYTQTRGGHTWPNWRAYLADFAPLLFR